MLACGREARRHWQRRRRCGRTSDENRCKQNTDKVRRRPLFSLSLPPSFPRFLSAHPPLSRACAAAAAARSLAHSVNALRDASERGTPSSDAALSLPTPARLVNSYLTLLSNQLRQFPPHSLSHRLRSHHCSPLARPRREIQISRTNVRRSPKGTLELTMLSATFFSFFLSLLQHASSTQRHNGLELLFVVVGSCRIRSCILVSISG